MMNYPFISRHFHDWLKMLKDKPKSKVERHRVSLVKVSLLNRGRNVSVRPQCFIHPHAAPKTPLNTWHPVLHVNTLHLMHTCRFSPLDNRMRGGVRWKVWGEAITRRSDRHLLLQLSVNRRKRSESPRHACNAIHWHSIITSETRWVSRFGMREAL